MHQRTHLLVVDDEVELRETLAEELEENGYMVTQAAGGEQALNILLAVEQKVDLVISDVQMPGGDGVGLLKAIRAKNPNLPMVIMMTGFANLSPQEAQSLGAYSMVGKPFELKIMLESIQEALKTAGL